MPEAPATPPAVTPPDLTLLEWSGTLGRAERKRLRPLSFAVPAGVRALSVFLDYRPRRLTDESECARLVGGTVDEQLDDLARAGQELPAGAREAVLAQPMLRRVQGELRTLLNLVLLDPQGRHRGRWDHNWQTPAAAEEDTIAEEWASPGYVPGPLPTGTWVATLEVHEVLGDEPCACHLRIVGRAQVPLVEARQQRAQRPPTPREYATPLPPGWVRGELHCHSTASDGRYAPEDLVSRAVDLGLDFLALTDHNTTAGNARLDRGAGFPLLAGCEVTTFHGHFLILGLEGAEEAPAWYEGERVLPPRELAAWARARGALFGLAHPFVLGNPVCAGCRLEVPVDPGDLDLVEVWSRGAEDAPACRRALAYFDELRREGHRVVAAAGRDWHGPGNERQRAGHAFPATVVRAAPDPSSILDALRRGACYLSVGPIAELVLRAGRSSAGIGERLGLDGRAATITASVRVEGLEAPASLELHSGGERILARGVGPGSVCLEVPGVIARPGGVRLEVWTEGEPFARWPLVITNPVDF